MLDKIRHNPLNPESEAVSLNQRILELKNNSLESLEAACRVFLWSSVLLPFDVYRRTKILHGGSITLTVLFWPDWKC